MATEYKSPLPGLLDYIVPDRLEQQAISAFSRPLTQEQLAKENDAQRKARLTQYGNFTPNIDPNNPQGLSNIETLFGTAYMPQAMTYSGGKGPSNKQMIDAAILRAGLELGKGRLPGETFGGALARGVKAAGGSSPTIGYRTGQEALAAGEAALGKDAKISVFQRSDGTFGYQGTTAKNDTTFDSYFGEQLEEDNVTKEQYDKAVAAILLEFPDATEQDIKDTLEANNIRFTGSSLEKPINYTLGGGG